MFDVGHRAFEKAEIEAWTRSGNCLESPAFHLGEGADEMVLSWNAQTPGRSWLELGLSVETEEGWSPWRCMGLWADGNGALDRRSVEGQSGRTLVATDVLKVPGGARRARIRAALCGYGPERPSLRRMSLAWSSGTADSELARCAVSPRDAPREAFVLDAVPRFSQMLFPPDGTRQCSPACVSMIMGYWAAKGFLPLDQAGISWMRAATEGVYDHVYKAWGNWSFNVAWAGSLGLAAEVRRFRSLEEAYGLVERGVPLALSISWNAEKAQPLDGAPLPKSSGHLTLLVGWDEAGNPLMNEPAMPDHASVRRSYDRSQLEARWLGNSKGTAYVIRPEGWTVE